MVRRAAAVFPSAPFEWSRDSRPSAFSPRGQIFLWSQRYIRFLLCRHDDHWTKVQLRAGIGSKHLFGRSPWSSARALRPAVTATWLSSFDTSEVAGYCDLNPTRSPDRLRSRRRNTVPALRWICCARRASIELSPCYLPRLQRSVDRTLEQRASHVHSILLASRARLRRRRLCGAMRWQARVMKISLIEPALA